LHAGAGGEEAQDWTDMLLRMYTGFADKNGLSLKIMDYLYGDGAGYKSVTFMVEGPHAYGNFKCERGVHRLVRISPFDANKRRHTSFSSVEVSPIIEDTTTIEVRPDEIKVDTYRAGGAGGQHINKTESAVRITHIPTGIIVACQNERSQTQNRELAMKMLYAKLAERAEQKKEEERLKQLGLQRKIEWGSQIRSYVLCPYTMVKDHRTNYEEGDADSVLDGNIKQFITEKLKFDKSNYGEN
jgi:peptide chain release factor 2